MQVFRTVQICRSPLVVLKVHIGRVLNPDPVFEIRSVPDPVIKIWSDPDPVFTIWLDLDGKSRFKIDQRLNFSCRAY